MRHPFPDDDGAPVTIRRPSTPTPLAAWHDAGAIATVVPGGPLPDGLHGVPFLPCPLPAASALPDDDAADPPFLLPPGMKAAAGAVVVEPDGRIWLVAPTNGFGGYVATFPKGRVDPGAGLRATARREAWEEAGLAVDIGSFLLDVSRTQTYTRYFLARRTGGSPAAMGWETQAVHLVPPDLLDTVAVHANDRALIAAVIAALRPASTAPAPTPRPPGRTPARPR
jgi:8-oxo-dGTP pyrophosphatase MutT (NUDIX family)